MSDESNFAALRADDKLRETCHRCNGLVSGTIYGDDKVCGFAVSAPASAPRTDCRGFEDFARRTEERLRELEAAVKRCGA